MLKWESKSLGEKVILELIALILISQISRFDIMIYVGVIFGVPVLGATLNFIVAIMSMVLFITFVTHLVQWLKSKGKNDDSKEKELR